METKNRIKLTAIILIFLLFTSWGISNWIIDSKYEESSQLTKQIDDLIKDYPNETKLKNIQKEILFINSVCFEQEEINVD